MPAALETLIDLGYNDGTTALNNLLSASNLFITLGTNINGQQWAAAQTTCNNISSYFSGFAKYLLQDDVFSKGLRRHWKDALYWINDNWPTDGGVEMWEIINAMLSASFDELQSFIGIEDAYRVAIWNAPFNSEFYSALARGFQKWP